ncbi:MAG: A24 family peptidase [Pseudomonadota bacterium]
MTPLGLFLLLAAPCFGSFAALLAQRMAAGQEALTIPSRCDGCGRRLRMWELVPLLSWLWRHTLRRGRAPCCGYRLPPGLFVPELLALAGTLWAILVLPEPLWPVGAGLSWVLLALSLIDLRLYRLPDPGTLGLLLAGLALAAAGFVGPLHDHALGALIGFGTLAGIAWAYRRLRGVEGMGLGDAKLLAAAGAWCGWTALPSVMLIACLAGLGLAAAAAMRGGAISAKTALPFGPALAFGFWITWLHGPLVLA